VAEGSFTALFSRGGTLTGAIGVARPADIRTLRGLLASGDPVRIDDLAALPG
jgi:hypothetical protein